MEIILLEGNFPVQSKGNNKKSQRTYIAAGFNQSLSMAGNIILWDSRFSQIPRFPYCYFFFPSHHFLLCNASRKTVPALSIRPRGP